jgi:uncharacterized peroxidase-related enzyme
VSGAELAESAGWYPVPAESELPPDIQKLFVKVRENLGFVPNVFRTYSFRPDRLRTWFAHFRSLHVATEHLSVADREMIAVVVSMANGCLYCLVAHGAALREALDDPVLGDRITLDWRRAGLDPRQQAICRYAEKLTRTPVEMTAGDIESLRAVGLDAEECWDVAEVAAMYNFTNRMAMATNMLPNEEYHALARTRAPDGVVDERNGPVRADVAHGDDAADKEQVWRKDAHAQ